MSRDRIRAHVKNNHWAPGTFPNTPAGEEVFTITRGAIDAALEKFPGLAEKLDIFIDWDEDNFRSSMASADVLLTWNLPTADIAAIAPRLRWIHIIGAGVEHLLPMDWVPPNVTITNNKGVHAEKAGEFGLMAVLMLHTHMPKILTNQRHRRYVSLYASPIAGRTLVVIGTGSLGGSAARKLQQLGMTVIGVNRRGRPVEGCERVVTTAGLDAVLPLADYLLIATPDTPETRGLMDRRRLDLLKATAGVINIGREAVMDYDALCDKLEAGTLAGAILDVFDPEPVETDSRLWTTPNLILTPHVSADDGDRYVPMTLELFFANMQRFTASEPLGNVVDPKLGY